MTVDAEARSEVQELSEEEWEGELHAESEEHAEQTSGEAEKDGLQQVDLHNLLRTCAERFHDGDGVEALLQVRTHCHCDADRAEDESDKRHEGEKAGGSVECAGESRVGLAVVCDLRFG